MNIVVENPIEETPQEIGQNEPETVAVAPQVLLAERIAQMFDLGPNEVSKYKNKLNVLIDYAKSKTEDHSVEGLKWALRSLSTKLGTPHMGEKLIDYMHRFAYLSLEGQKIDSEKQRFLNGND